MNVEKNDISDEKTSLSRLPKNYHGVRFYDEIRVLTLRDVELAYMGYSLALESYILFVLL